MDELDDAAKSAPNALPYIAGLLTGVRPDRDMGLHDFELRIPICRDCPPESAFEAVRYLTGPGAPYARDGINPVTLTGNNPIWQIVDPNALTIKNITRPGHRYHPGTVTLSVVRDPDGNVSLLIVGEGTGSYATEDERAGALLFHLLGSSARALYDMVQSKSQQPPLGILIGQGGSPTPVLSSPGSAGWYTPSTNSP